MSEPKHIREILPEVMQNIARRVNRYREAHNLPKLQEGIGENEHRAGVLDAVRDFHKHRKSRSQPQKREAKNKKRTRIVAKTAFRTEKQGKPSDRKSIALCAGAQAAQSTVGDAVRKLSIKPLGLAGQVRVFPENAPLEVRKFLDKQKVKGEKDNG